MRILVTAGNTQTPIDRVRCITNIFSGRTGTNIALHAARQGNNVCLLTSHPELASREAGQGLRIERFQTFDDLHQLLEREVSDGGYDAIVHAAAVADFAVAGVYYPNDLVEFDSATRRWQMSPTGESADMVQVRDEKIKSTRSELWLRLTPTVKLVDRFRRDWGYAGILVKFKLEVGIDEGQLLQIAEFSRQQSAANFIVANTLEGKDTFALLVRSARQFRRLTREELPAAVLAEIETDLARSA